MDLDACFDRVLDNAVPHDKAAWHEWACLKAYLSNEPKADCQEVYKELYGSTHPNLETAPKWLIILACSWKGAELGHLRTKHLFSGIDKQTLAVVRQLDEKAIVYVSNVHKHLRMTDPEFVR